MYSVNDERIEYDIYDRDVIFQGESVKTVIKSDKKRTLDLYYLENGIKTFVDRLTVEENTPYPFPNENHYLRFDTEGLMNLQVEENGTVLSTFHFYVVNGVNKIDPNTPINSSSATNITPRKYAIAPSEITTDTRGMREKLVYKDLIKSTVLVETSTGSIGGGVFVDKTHVLTNWHVIKNSKFVTVAFRASNSNTASVEKNTYLSAKVVKFDRIKDLALLEIQDKKAVQKINPIKLANINNVQPGDDIFTIGHPEGELFTLDTGIISQVRQNYSWKTNEQHQADYIIQVKNSISNGSSGGPLVNENLELIGLNTFSKIRGQNLNFAISVADIKTFLDTKKKPSVSNIKNPEKPSKERIIKTQTGFDSQGNPIARHQIDTNNNNCVDLVAYDFGRDGIYNYYLYDTDEDGKFDKRCYDKDGDGIKERCLKL